MSDPVTHSGSLVPPSCAATSTGSRSKPEVPVLKTARLVPPDQPLQAAGAALARPCLRGPHSGQRQPR